MPSSRRSNAQRVEQFHEAFSSPSSYWPDRDLIALRKRLVREEYEELGAELDLAMRQGLTAELRLKVAKELSDLLYVVYGLATAFQIDADECFALVHASNMSKLGLDGKPIVREDGKVLKGPGYFEPDLSVPANIPMEGETVE